MKTFSYPWVLSSILENGSLLSILETVFQSDDIDSYIEIDKKLWQGQRLQFLQFSFDHGKLCMM